MSGPGSSSQQALFAVPGIPSSSSSSSNAVQSPVLTSSSSTNAPAQRHNAPVQRAISPPTPAPSPQPEARTLRHASSSHLHPSDEEYESIQSPSDLVRTGQKKENEVAPLLRQFLREFPAMNPKDRHTLLAHFVDLCNARELAHLSSLISPRLKVDFLSALPIEVSLHIISYLDDPRTLARACSVSRFWRSLVNDEQTWKIMCKRYHFRQVPVSRSLQTFGLETPDQTMEQTSTDSEFTASNGAEHGSLESSQVLGGLYDAYIARGLDPSMALSELKALHELFLTKRTRELGIEERRRQLHALQNDNVFMDMMRDNAFATRMADASMSEDDKRFYSQLEDFIREKQAETGTDPAGETGSSVVRSPDGQDAATVGWLSTGPPSTRTLGVSGLVDGHDDPRTPLAPSSSRYFGQASALPLREVGRSLVSPTSRLGSMTSGLLTSLWDRTSGVSAPAGASLDVSESVHSHPPSAGDHGHSAQGHNDPEDTEGWAEDEEMVEQEANESAPQDEDMPEAWTQNSSSSTGHNPTEGQFVTHRRIYVRKSSRRFAPFHRNLDDAPSSDNPASASTSSLGLGRPSVHSNRLNPLRSATVAEGMTDPTNTFGEPHDKQDSASDFAAKRAASLAHDSQNAARRSRPFSYKTHFKLAYQTESNWLRGGRLLTQHVSSDDASGEGATVTSLSIDDEWIVVGMANAKIHAFDARTGLFVRTLNGHTAGVWCLALVSASGRKKSTSTGKGKDKATGSSANRTSGDGATPDDSSRSIGAYPYDNDRPLYTPTPDLNLIHHDPRPAASVFSPETRYTDLAEGGDDDHPFFRPSMPMPTQSASWSHQQPQQRAARSIHDTLQANRHMMPENEGSFSASTTPPPKEAVEAAAAARSTQQNQGARRMHSSGSNYTTRGAGLGSNFGSPCGSVAGYGNENAIVVSSGCDRDVRVWDLATGECKFVLSGHRSTVRCLRVFEGRPIAISGSRDGTMRVWNIETGTIQHLLPGHQHSVRCIDLAGNLVASASYDCTARIWNVDTGKCLHVLRGHYHQLYAIAFDGVHVATGSLDSTVRIWNAETGECLATLQGHQSLVGQLQLTDSTLITGGSDGRVIVFSLKTMKMVYQLLAHENSVTCLQFDDRFIVTGGNDGKVKLWNFRTGEYVRELCESSGQVWKVSFRDDKCVVLCRRNDKTAMDVISFRPIEESA